MDQVEREGDLAEPAHRRQHQQVARGQAPRTREDQSRAAERRQEGRPPRIRRVGIEQERGGHDPGQPRPADDDQARVDDRPTQARQPHPSGQPEGDAGPSAALGADPGGSASARPGADRQQAAQAQLPGASRQAVEGPRGGPVGEPDRARRRRRWSRASGPRPRSGAACPGGWPRSAAPARPGRTAPRRPATSSAGTARD